MRPQILLAVATLVVILGSVAEARLDGGARSAASLAVLGYVPHERPIANPERGFFEVQYSEALGNYHPLSVDSLAKQRREGYTLVRRYFLLGDFFDHDISDDYLAAVRRDFEAAREAGVKLIPRFSYTNERNAQRRDASPERVLRHIEQLTPLLRENADVVAVLEAGFIGIWGEWAYTSHFSDPYAVDYSDRQQILEALLAALPQDRQVMIRTPRYKYRMSLAQADAGRVGFYNDCFLRDETDGGTFLGDQVDAERAYLALEVTRVAVGGETCSVPQDRFDDALADFRLFRWSYLNGHFHPGHLDRWRREGTLTEIERRLGYRLELVNGEYSRAASPGGTLSVEITLRNVGWAAPINPRQVQVVLRAENGIVRRLEVPADARGWYPGADHRVGGELWLPEDLAPGQYELLLHLADPAPALQDRAEFAIQLANEGTWEAETGYNRLFHTVTIE